MRKTEQEIIEEIETDYAHSIKDGMLSVSDKVERAFSDSGEYMGAWVTVYAFVDDSDDE